jgi:alanine racemase
MSWTPRALIDHIALRRNLSRVRAVAPGSRVWAVVKANGYGHGAQAVVASLDADGLAVARLGEARQLRESGERRPLLVMGGVGSAASLRAAAELGCELALHDDAQAELLVGTRLSGPLGIWIKVNTGMNRLGMAPDSVPAWLRRLELRPWVRRPVGLMTHLANADDLQDPMTEAQCGRLRAIPDLGTRPLSIANSAGLLGHAAARSHWVRPGIMLYGVSPFLGETGAQRGLEPVMTLSAPVIAVNHCRAGDRVGYGGTYQCPDDMPVGVIGVGYGDGYPRHAPSGTPVLIGTERAPLVGRVSMDMITVDLRELPEVRIGDEAVLWGRGLPAEEIAAAAGTIAYQLFTGVTDRVERVHLGRGDSGTGRPRDAEVTED